MLGWYSDYEDVNVPALLGPHAVIEDVVAVGSDATIHLRDGRTIEYQLDGECCSKSYFADEKQFHELKGRRLRNFEFRDGVGVRDDYPHDGVKTHFLVFTTDEGHATIDWRNESNGYYDGRCAWRISNE